MSRINLGNSTNVGNLPKLLVLLLIKVIIELKLEIYNFTNESGDETLLLLYQNNSYLCETYNKSNKIIILANFVNK